MSEPMDSVQSPEEIEELRAEVDRLKEENLRLSGEPSPARKARTRTNWAIVLVVIGALIFAITPTAIWLRNQVFSTEKWVETVAPLAEDPAIQAAVATAASDAIIENLDAEQRIKDLLPDQLNLDRFAPLLASSAENAIRTQATKFTQSDQFAKLWAEINRVGHKALITSITGREGIVSVQAGTFTLDTGLLIDRVKTGLTDRGLGFVANIPTSRLEREVEIYHSDTLAAAGPILDAIQSAAYIIPLFAIAFVAGGFALAANRQRVALWFGISVTVFGLMPLQALYLGQYAVGRQAERTALVPSDAAVNAFGIIFRNLILADRAVVGLGLLIVLAAVLAGPARWAVGLRSGVSGGIESAASHLELGSFGAWVNRHKMGLRVVGFVLAAALLVILPGPRTFGTVLWLAVLVVLWIALVEFLGAAHSSASADAMPAEGAEALEPTDEAGSAPLDAQGEQATDEVADALTDVSSPEDAEGPEAM